MASGVTGCTEVSQRAPLGPSVRPVTRANSFPFWDAPPDEREFLWEHLPRMEGGEPGGQGLQTASRWSPHEMAPAGRVVCRCSRARASLSVFGREMQ